MKLYLILAVVHMLVACTATAQHDSTRTITVRGFASTYVEPDNVAWSLTIAIKDDNLAELRNRSAEILEQVEAAVTRLGIVSEDFRIGGARINMQYKYKDHRETDDFSHYTLSQTFTVIQRDVEDYGEFWNELTAFDGIKVRQTFYVSDLKELESEMQIEALREAKQEAMELSSVVGDSVGRALWISEFKPSESTSDGLTMSYVRATPAFSPEQVEISASIYVVFELL